MHASMGKVIDHLHCNHFYVSAISTFPIADDFDKFPNLVKYSFNISILHVLTQLNFLSFLVFHLIRLIL